MKMRRRQGPSCTITGGVRVVLLAVGIVVACLIGVMPAHAAIDSVVIDEASVLSAEQERDLRRNLSNFSNQVNAQVNIVFIRDVEGPSPSTVAEEWFDRRGMGVGENRDGVLFLVATESRDMHYLMNGTPYHALEREWVEETVQQAGRYFALGKWYEGAMLYGERTAEGLNDYQNSVVFAGRTVEDVGWSLAGGSLAGVLLLTSGETLARRKLVNMGIATRAHDYLVPNSAQLLRDEEVMTGQSVHTVALPPPSSSSSSSSGGWSSSGSSRGGYSARF